MSSFYLVILVCAYSCDSIFVTFNESVIVGKYFRTIFGDKSYAGFFNIPYAEPPLAELRFKPPIGPRSFENYKIYAYDQDTDQWNGFTEDCLYLSIFMPLSKNTKPVLVWLHEHSYWHGPDFFIDEEILVVTVSFRTGIFGFLNTEDEFAEGNLGVKDIQMSLEWLKHNVNKFNGDPKSITIVGAGLAATPAASMLLNMGKELFSKIIVLSGSALSPADYKNFNFEIANKLFNRLGDPLKRFNRKELYELLKNGTTDKLLSASRELFDSTEVRDNQRLINPFGCSLEIASKDPFMKWTPIEMYNRKAVNNVPVLIGYTSLPSLCKIRGLASNRELLKYLNYNFQYLLPFEGRVDEYNCKRYKKIKQRIKEFYFLNGTITERSLRRFAKYLSDIDIFPLLRQASLQSDISSCPVYLYRFAFKGSFNIGWRNCVPNLNWSGASLHDEICYLFKCKSLNHVYNRAESNERDFIKKIVRLLANFIKHGNPTPHDNDEVLKNIQWMPLSKGKHLKAINFGKLIRMRDIPEEERMRFWYHLQRDFVTLNNS
ncbi:juvenile hormone esterase-like [Pieris napi]|uniref:juvenile hormone esterase-like n=1 Tax=Pieris napi TaxID=78633 RepID=UPI001FBBC9A4|nr:juvenile hormone esterase-like [Pieris napi]